MSAPTPPPPPGTPSPEALGALPVPGERLTGPEVGVYIPELDIPEPDRLPQAAQDRLLAATRELHALHNDGQMSERLTFADGLFTQAQHDWANSWERDFTAHHHRSPTPDEKRDAIGQATRAYTPAWEAQIASAINSEFAGVDHHPESMREVNALSADQQNLWTDREVHSLFSLDNTIRQLEADYSHEQVVLALAEAHDANQAEADRIRGRITPETPAPTADQNFVSRFMTNRRRRHEQNVIADRQDNLGRYQELVRARFQDTHGWDDEDGVWERQDGLINGIGDRFVFIGRTFMGVPTFKDSADLNRLNRLYENTRFEITTVRRTKGGPPIPEAITNEDPTTMRERANTARALRGAMDLIHPDYFEERQQALDILREREQYITDAFASGRPHDNGNLLLDQGAEIQRLGQEFPELRAERARLLETYIDHVYTDRYQRLTERPPESGVNGEFIQYSPDEEAGIVIFDAHGSPQAVFYRGSAERGIPPSYRTLNVTPAGATVWSGRYTTTGEVVDIPEREPEKEWRRRRTTMSQAAAESELHRTQQAHRVDPTDPIALNDVRIATNDVRDVREDQVDAINQEIADIDEGVGRLATDYPDPAERARAAATLRANRIAAETRRRTARGRENRALLQEYFLQSQAGERIRTRPSNADVEVAGISEPDRRGRRVRTVQARGPTMVIHNGTLHTQHGRVLANWRFRSDRSEFETYDETGRTTARYDINGTQL